MAAGGFDQQLISLAKAEPASSGDLERTKLRRFLLNSVQPTRWNGWCRPTAAVTAGVILRFQPQPRRSPPGAACIPGRESDGNLATSKLAGGFFLFGCSGSAASRSLFPKRRPISQARAAAARATTALVISAVAQASRAEIG